MSNLSLNHEVNHDEYKADGLAFALVKKFETFFSFFSLLDHDTSKTIKKKQKKIFFFFLRKHVGP